MDTLGGKEEGGGVVHCREVIALSEVDTLGGKEEGGRGGVLSTVESLSLSQKLLMYNGHTEK